MRCECACAAVSACIHGRTVRLCVHLKVCLLSQNPAFTVWISRRPQFPTCHAQRSTHFHGLLSSTLHTPQVLRYVGVVDTTTKEAKVELRRYPKSHAFAQLTGSDNIILFSTSRYMKQPLIIRGPGAGAEVTAGGVFSDLLRLCTCVVSPM